MVGLGLGTCAVGGFNVIKVMLSLTMIDIDSNGYADLIVTSPFGKYSEIHAMKAAQHALCHRAELILANRGESHFGWRVKSMHNSPHFYASSLFVSSPREARIEQFIQSDGYTVDIYSPNATINIDPTLNGSADFVYCVSLIHTPIVNAPYKFHMQVDTDKDNDWLELERHNLQFTFNSFGAQQCQSVRIYLNYALLNLSTATISVLGAF